MIWDCRTSRGSYTWTNKQDFLSIADVMSFVETNRAASDWRGICHDVGRAFLEKGGHCVPQVGNPPCHLFGLQGNNFFVPEPSSVIAGTGQMQEIHVQAVEVNGATKHKLIGIVAYISFATCIERFSKPYMFVLGRRN